MDREVKDLTEGGAEICAPTNGKIRCIKNKDGKPFLLEHEHADHSDYIMPIMVTMANKDEYEKTYNEKWYDEEHALIYTDGFIIVTLYEYCYDMFLISGECKTRNWKYDDGRPIKFSLTKNSIKKIREYLNNKNK